MSSRDPMRRCTATNRSGERCGSYAIPGGTVCRLHGGAAPQVAAKAAERVKAIRDAAGELLLEKITGKTRDVDARVLLSAVKELSELVETLEGRVARREGVDLEVDDVAGSRERLAQQLACIAGRERAPEGPGATE